MTHFQMYLITILDGVVALELLLAIGFGTFSLIAAFNWGFNSGLYGPSEAGKRIFYKSWWIPVIFSALFAVTPSTKQAIAIYVVPKVVNNQDIQAIGEDSLKLVKQWLEDQLEDRRR